MRQTIAAVVAVLALAACPEVATPADGSDGTAGSVGPQGPQGEPGPQGPAGASSHQSGSRIKSRMGRTPDGAAEFRGWHDSARGENCSFLRAEDGVTRCLPYEHAVANMAESTFSDPDCTIPAGHTPDCSQDKRYLIQVVTGGQCTADYSYVVYESAPLPDAAPIYSKGAECVPAARYPGYDYVYATAKVPADAFQQMTETIE